MSNERITSMIKLTPNNLNSSLSDINTSSNLSLENNSLSLNDHNEWNTHSMQSQLNNNYNSSIYLPEKYNSSEKSHIKLIYIVAIVLWIIVAFFLFNLLHVGTLIIMCIPILLFGLTIKNLDELDDTCEGYLGHTDNMNFWLFAAFPILSWVNDRYNGDSSKFYTIITVGIFISIVSLFDFWIPKKYEKYMKHIRSILNTCSLTLLLVSICMMFLEHHNIKNNNTTNLLDTSTSSDSNNVTVMDTNNYNDNANPNYMDEQQFQNLNSPILSQ
jgi:hypothetical protein